MMTRRDARWKVDGKWVVLRAKVGLSEWIGCVMQERRKAWERGGGKRFKYVAKAGTLAGWLI